MLHRKIQTSTIVDQDGAAILDLERGLMSTLNPTAAYVWEKLGRGESVESIVDNLARETGEASDLIARDVHEFIGALRQNHLLSR